MSPRKESKKRRSPRAYLNDFQRSVSGEYIYTGVTYSFACDGKTRRRALTGLWIPGGMSFICTVVQGCIPAPGALNCAYVLLPYACQLICAASVIWALLRLSGSREPIREYVYTATVKVLPLRCGFTAGFAALTLIGDAIFLVLHGVGDIKLSALFFALGCAAAICAVLSFFKLRKLRWLKNDADT